MRTSTILIQRIFPQMLDQILSLDPMLSILLKKYVSEDQVDKWIQQLRMLEILLVLRLTLEGDAKLLIFQW